MAYVKTTWKIGDKVTSTKLNKIEQGIYDNDAACDELNTALSEMNTATSSDVNKALAAKTVSEGKVTEWKFVSVGGGGGSFDGVIELNAENESSVLGEELASSDGWVLNQGWTGDFVNGFTHSSGTASLEFPIDGIEQGKMYLVSFNSSVDATNTNILVSIGNSDTFPLYGMPKPYNVGAIAKDTTNLKFIPETGFTGTISDVSIKEITDVSIPYIYVEDTDGKNSVEFRTGNERLSNLFLGEESGQYNATGFGNVGLGTKTLSQVIGGFWNTAVGLSALRDNVSGSRNVGIGYGALMSNISGHRNIAIGTFSLLNNTIGHNNVAIGADTLDNNTEGYYNIAIGFQSLYSILTGYSNIALGKGAGQALTTGHSNIMIGENALPSATTAQNNVSIGDSTLSNTTGNSNVGIGNAALYRNTAGANNVAIGANAGTGSNKATQSQNVFIGAQAGYNIYNGVTQNTFIGYRAGYTLVSGHNNICIGAECDVPSSSKSNYVNIGNLIKGSIETGSEYTEVLGDLFVVGTDGVKRQIVFNNDNTISWQAV